MSVLPVTPASTSGAVIYDPQTGREVTAAEWARLCAERNPQRTAAPGTTLPPGAHGPVLPPGHAAGQTYSTNPHVAQRQMSAEQMCQAQLQAEVARQAGGHMLGAGGWLNNGIHSIFGIGRSAGQSTSASPSASATTPQPPKKRGFWGFVKSVGRSVVNAAVGATVGVVKSIVDGVKSFCTDENGNWSIGKTLLGIGLVIGVGALMLVPGLQFVGLALAGVGIAMAAPKVLKHGAEVINNYASGNWEAAEESATHFGQAASELGLSFVGGTASLRALQAAKAAQATRGVTQAQQALRTARNSSEAVQAFRASGGGMQQAREALKAARGAESVVQARQSLDSARRVADALKAEQAAFNQAGVLGKTKAMFSELMPGGGLGGNLRFSWHNISSRVSQLRRGPQSATSQLADSMRATRQAAQPAANPAQPSFLSRWFGRGQNPPAAAPAVPGASAATPSVPSAIPSVPPAAPAVARISPPGPVPPGGLPVATPVAASTGTGGTASTTWLGQAAASARQYYFTPEPGATSFWRRLTPVSRAVQTGLPQTASQARGSIAAHDPYRPDNMERYHYGTTCTEHGPMEIGPDGRPRLVDGPPSPPGGLPPGGIGGQAPHSGHSGSVDAHSLGPVQMNPPRVEYAV